jgi:hypothetical protein
MRYRVRVTFQDLLEDFQIDALMETFSLATSVSGERLTVEVWSGNSVDVLRRLAVGLAEAAAFGYGLPAVKQIRITALRGE